jgi:hypothetical protein
MSISSKSSSWQGALSPIGSHICLGLSTDPIFNLITEYDRALNAIFPPPRRPSLAKHLYRPQCLSQREYFLSRPSSYSLSNFSSGDIGLIGLAVMVSRVPSYLHIFINTCVRKGSKPHPQHERQRVQCRSLQSDNIQGRSLFGK